MTTDDNKPIVLDTPDQISFWLITSRMFQLALELNTGMTHSSGPLLATMYAEGLIPNKMRSTKKNKQMVLRCMVEASLETRPGWRVPATVQSALDKVL